MTLNWQQRRLGVCYYPEHWPREQWAADARQMVEKGISLVRLAEFSWSLLEPEPGRLAFGWLDDAMATLAAEGLKVILCTPTATPPRWMLERHPDMLAVGMDGRPRGFGSRRHYDFSHIGYRDECVRIATLMGERYGKHDAVVAWQLDNEYGCHDTIRSTSMAARTRFQAYLREHYTTIGALNSAWGNVFWSMLYSRFEEIDLPIATVTEPNPSHTYDFYRFASDEVVAFNRAQAQALRPLSPGRPIVHNYMGRTVEFDHYAVGADLDAATWDSYPVGFLENVVAADDEHKRAFARQGDPDFQAFHHDLYRAVGRGALWVMEQQPGPVNWAQRNPVPLPGMVRLWCWEAFAHGASLVSVFRWRQAPFAQEQMHAGLLLPDSTPGPGLAECATVARELLAFPATAITRAPVALVFDYASAWAGEITPHSVDFTYFDLVFSAYRALRRLGLSVDIIGPDLDELSQYQLALVPGLVTLSETAKANLTRASTPVILGPRVNAKTPTFHIPADLPPDLGACLDLKVTAAETIRPDCPINAQHGALRLWREHVSVGPEAKVDGLADDGWPVSVGQGHLTYVAGWPDDALWQHLIKKNADAAGVETFDVPGGVGVRDMGGHRFIVNYNAYEVNVSHLAPSGFALGGPVLEPTGVAIAELP
ncbi:MAG: beta-galactosidase [Pseudomonadota bacterium]